VSWTRSSEGEVCSGRKSTTTLPPEEQTTPTRQTTPIRQTTSIRITAPLPPGPSPLPGPTPPPGPSPLPGPIPPPGPLTLPGPTRLEYRVDSPAIQRIQISIITQTLEAMHTLRATSGLMRKTVGHRCGGTVGWQVVVRTNTGALQL